MSIKAKRGITYECYRGFEDISGNRARRGQRYVLLYEYIDHYLFHSASGKGDSKLVKKDKFTAHFIPLNPLEALYIPFE